VGGKKGRGPGIYPGPLSFLRIMASKAFVPASYQYPPERGILKPMLTMGQIFR